MTRFKLASTVLRARSESFTESDDTSYASEINNNDSSEASTASSSAASSSENDSSSTAATETNTATNLSKATITQVVVPRKIVIKYSANIETPKIAPPLAVIGAQGSESSDPVESDFSESNADDDDDDTHKRISDSFSKGQSFDHDDAATLNDQTELSTETDNDDYEDIEEEEEETESEDESNKNSKEIIHQKGTDPKKAAIVSEDEEQSEDETESEEDDETESEVSESEEEPEESLIENGHNNQNGYANNTNKSKSYGLDDFQLLKTIGKFSSIFLLILF